jgi:hypothetical protein
MVKSNKWKTIEQKEEEADAFARKHMMPTSDFLWWY